MDDGATWQELKLNLPAVAVHDLLVKDNDLVLATHGRGIWIIDDITPWRALSPEVLTQDVSFISARPVQQRIEGSGGWANGSRMDAISPS